MASTPIRSDSKDGDFEVVPKTNQEFLSLNSPTQGDPFENRADIHETKEVLENVLAKLNFKDENDIDELHNKLKSREALDAGIGGEIANLEDITKNEEMASEKLRSTAKSAKELILKARGLAYESKTTVKRALDLLEISLPVFIRACEISKEKPELSGDFVQLQDLYKNTMQEMVQHQKAFEMEEREKKLAEGKGLLERSISAAISDRERVCDKIDEENEQGQLEHFTQAQSEVMLMIDTENKELDAWMVSCRADLSSLEEAKQRQIERYTEATKKYSSRLKIIDTSLDVNKKRQEDLEKQLKQLKDDENRLKNNRMLEEQVQERATELNSSVTHDLGGLEKKVTDIKDHARIAQEIILIMHQCSSLLFHAAIETQTEKEQKLRQLEIEALTREATALATAAVEFKVQIQMGEENIKEYSEQMETMKKEIEMAAKKGRALIVTRKRQELAEFEQEIKKESESTEESKLKLEKM